jgi:predicted enzyme related to lactoylglutathione lyase
MSTTETAVGKFVWHEQVSSEPEKAREFYTALLGWDVEVFKPGEIDYTMISSGGRLHGGFGKAMEGAPPPHWLGHVQVEDIDETVEKAKAAGGRLAAGPFDLPEVGRMAIIGDPQGAFVAVYHPANDGPAAEGVFVWDELVTKDIDDAARFYGELFGWTVEDMGADFGGYRIFKRGETSIGGLMAPPDPAIPNYWQPYVGAADTDATVAKAKELGATVLVEPMDVPTVGRFAVLADPQGAVFGVIRGEPSS